MKFKAYLVEEVEGSFNGSIQEIELPPLEDGKVHQLPPAKNSSNNSKGGKKYLNKMLRIGHLF